MNNTVQDIINKIPTVLYFTEIPDRQQALKYLDYLYQNVPQSKNIDFDILSRAVIAHQLRIVSMKIIEPEILFLIALNKITLGDLTLSSNDLVKKVIAENPDKFDLDICYRVLAQIMTKIPRDLRERITGKHKLQVFQLVAQHIKMDTKLLERFIAFDPTLNTPISMELDTNDYKTLNDKYLRELYNFKQTQPYINSNSMEYGALASQLAQTTLSTQPITNANGNLKAKYIDQTPDLMLGTKDNTLYYFDSSSGVISEMPISGTNQTPVSLNDLKTVLTANKINQGDIQTAINSLTPKPTTDAETTSFINILENMFMGLFNGTTETKANIANQAQLPDNSPIPPSFLINLYNIKQNRSMNNNMGNGMGNGMVSRAGGEIANAASEYNSGWNVVSSRNANQTEKNIEYTPNIPNLKYNTTNTTDLIWGIDHSKLTNPQTTYKAFSAPEKHTRPIIGSNTNPTYADGTRMSNNAVIMEQQLAHLNSTYQHATTTTPATTTPATNTISHFNNMNNDVVSKIKNNNKDVENIALGFVSVIILIFLLVIFNTIRTSNSKA